MRKILLVLTAIICALPSIAQVGKNGYYRVHNYKSGRYVYVLDNKGHLDYQSSTADMGAIELWKDFSRASHNPATVCYIENQEGILYDIKAQGTGIYEIIGSHVKILKNDDGTYYAYGSKDNIVKYLSDAERNDSKEQSFMGDAANAGEYKKWYITPISTGDDNYFGIMPSLNVGGVNYSSFYTSFPYSFASSGMNAYYVTKIIDNYALVKEITGTVPAYTPVYVKMSSDQPINNKLNIGGSASDISGNLLKGVFFNNNTSAAHRNRTAYDPNTMRLLGQTADGSIGFITSNIDFIPANHAYLKVPAGSPAELKIITEEDYDKLSKNKPESITLNKTQITLVEGQKYTLKATVLPEDAFDKSVTWVTNNPAIALMDNGTVTAVKEGIVNVTATTRNGLVANCEVIVKKPVLPTGITLDKTQITLAEGQKYTLKATILPEDATDKTIKWVTNDPAIALMDNGTVTAVKKGIVNVTATTSNGFTANCEVIVKEPVMPSGLSLDKHLVTLKEGETYTLKATIEPEDATDKTITWSTEDPAIAEVENGTVKAIKEGSVKITAQTSNGIKAICKVVVNKKVMPEGIAFPETEITIVTGEEKKLMPVFTPENTTEKALTWATDNESIVTVEDGFVTAVAIGEANITATTVNNLKATCKIIVKAPTVLAESIMLDKSVYEAVEGTEFTLVATILPEDASSKTVAWSSSDEDVATVKHGVVKVLKEGTANITASTTDGTNLQAVCVVNGISGIEEVFADIAEFPVKVYNTNGILIKTAYSVNDIKSLSTGIYVIGGKKVVIAK